MYVVFCKSKLIVVGVYKQHSKAILSALDNGNALVLKCNNECKIKDFFIQLLRFYFFDSNFASSFWICFVSLARVSFFLSNALSFWYISLTKLFTFSKSIVSPYLKYWVIISFFLGFGNQMWWVGTIKILPNKNKKQMTL